MELDENVTNLVMVLRELNPAWETYGYGDGEVVSWRPGALMDDGSEEEPPF